jgi:hypothetical protein
VLPLVFAASDPSKVPFYIAGLLLALWAVCVSAYGVTHPDFPYSTRGQRGVIGVSLLLVVFAISMAIYTK